MTLLIIEPSRCALTALACQMRVNSGETQENRQRVEIQVDNRPYNSTNSNVSLLIARSKKARENRHKWVTREIANSDKVIQNNFSSR